MRPDRTRRRFTLLDLALLVLGAGCGFACARFGVGLPLEMRKRAPGDFDLSRAQLVRFGSDFLLAAGSLTLLVLMASPPRCPWPRLRRSPGFVAGVAALANLLWHPYLAICRLEGAGRGSFGRTIWWSNLVFTMVDPTNVGLCVALAWLVLALARGGFPRADDWPERAGRALGWAWIVLGLLNPLVGRWL